MNNSVVKKPLCDEICEHLRNSILNGELKPGERLMEIYFAKKMGVSRTPFREAVRKLEIEGLVTVLPRRGAHVTILSKKDIEEVLEIRGALDALAAALASQNMVENDINSLSDISKQFEEMSEKENIAGQIALDVAFHELIYLKSGNERLMNMYASLKDQIYRYRVLYLKNFSKSAAIIEEHKMIIDAIRKKSSSDAKSISEQHISSQMKSMLANVKKI